MSDTMTSQKTSSSTHDVASSQPSGSNLSKPTKPTPKMVRSCGGDFRQPDLGTFVANDMDGEFVTCSVKDFMNHYLPFSPSEEEAESCVASLAKGNTLTNIEGEPHKWAQYPCPPSQIGGIENNVFEGLQEIADGIASHRMEPGRPRNQFTWYLTPNKSIESDIPGFSTKIDGCIASALSSDVAKVSLHVSGVAVAVELKKLNKPDDEAKNNKQVVAANNHIMNDDPRRMYSYGITIVDDQMSVWYFSRSHSSVSESFSFVEDPATMIRVLMSFFFATEAELGYDPLVSRQTTSKETYYIYNLPEPDGSPVYYRTTRSISEYRSMCITGRMTRVWEVAKIKSPEEPKPLGKRKALKDVWLDDTAATEKAIQDAIFDDIRLFFDNGSWRDDARLAELPPAVVENLGKLFESGNYKRLFLSIERDYQGKTASKPVAPNSEQIRGLFTFELPASHRSSANFTSTSNRQPSDPLKPIAHAPDALEEGEKLERRYTPKRQYRLIYHELCTVIHQLPTLGEVMDILRETLVALQLLFCAGWVHRDISTGNILAFRARSNLPWAAKLSDLEYAKRFPPTEETASDPKTGTPFFMPFEIQSGAQLYVPFLGEQHGERVAFRNRKRAPILKVPVFHNFQHDLESIWWIILYSITERIGNSESTDYAARIFRNSLRPSISRENAIKYDIERNLQGVLIPPLQQGFPGYMEDARQCMDGAYRLRQQTDQVNVPGAYSSIHLAFHEFLEALEESRTAWSSTPLQVGQRKADPKNKPQRVRKRCLPKDDDDYETESQSNRSKRSRTGSSSRKSSARAISPLPSLTNMLTRSRTKMDPSTTGK